MSNSLVVNLENQLKSTGSSEVAEELTVSGTVVQGATFGDLVTHVKICVKTASVMYTHDGVDPATGGNGGILTANSERVWAKPLFAATKFIEHTGSGTAIIHCEPLSL